MDCAIDAAAQDQVGKLVLVDDLVDEIRYMQRQANGIDRVPYSDEMDPLPAVTMPVASRF